MSTIEKKAAIYPYNHDTSVFIRHSGLLPYKSLIPISPKGYGYDNSDAGLADKSGNLGVKVTSDFNQGITESDTVIFCDKVKDSLDKIYFSIEQGRNIVSLFKLSEDIERDIIYKCEKSSLEYINYSQIGLSDFRPDEQENNLKNINVPIILVCGMSDRTQKFDIQVSLRYFIEKMGYKVSQIGSRLYSKIFSMHNFPEYLLTTNDEYNKILYFNKYVKCIEMEEKPDVIIIGIPGGIIPYTKKINNGFGILAYLVSQAVNADATIFSMAYNEYDDDFFSYMRNFTSYRYGFNIDLFHLSNVYHDISDEHFDGKKCIIVNSEKIKQFKKQTDTKIFNVLDFNDAQMMSENIIDLLVNNCS